MIGMDSDSSVIVGQCLRGEREIDEKALGCASILAERLEGLRKLNLPGFERVSFSSEAGKLAEYASRMTV